MIGYNENQVEVYTKKLSKSLKDLPYGFGAAIGYSMITDNIRNYISTYYYCCNNLIINKK